jgi:hypothetical protein
MLATLLGVCATFSTAQANEMPWIAASKDKNGFVLEPSGKPFVPWGFNYDHDSQGRLLEDYWDDEWPTVEAHFGQMKKLGANVVRIHLQLGKFMDGPDKANEKALVLAGQGGISDQDFLERMARSDELVDHDGKTCGQCHYTILGAEVTREMIEAGEYEDVVSKWATEHKRRWEKSKFVKLWQEARQSGCDPHEAFQNRGWEP